MNIEEYNFKTEPYQHQIDTLKLSANENLYALFLEMGLGKSKIPVSYTHLTLPTICSV